MITNPIDYLSKSNQTSQKIDEFIETPNIPNILNSQENSLQEKTIVSAYELLKLEHESEILREQVESLKQELEYQHQLVREYKQELLQTNSEIEALNWELQDAARLEMLKLDEAKRLARNILSSRRLTSESLAELLSTICGVVVTADELEAIASQV